jgi:Mpv17 / PMP22 family
MTKMVSSGVIAASGDALCQSWFPKSTVAAGEDEADASDGVQEPGQPKIPPDDDGRSLPPWDWMRTGRFGILGTFLVAPTVHVWYNQLHRWTSNLSISSSPWRLLASRVAIDQLLFAPAFTAVWLVALRILEQGHPKHIEWEALRASVPDIVVANWALWVPAQLVNFAMVPLKFQVLYSNVVALAWNVYLSYTTSTSNRTSPSRNLSTLEATRTSEP